MNGMIVQLAEEWWFKKDTRDGCAIMDGDWIGGIVRRLTEIAERMPRCDDQIKLAEEVEYIVEHFHFGARAKQLCELDFKIDGINKRLKKLKEGEKR